MISKSRNVGKEKRGIRTGCGRYGIVMSMGGGGLTCSKNVFDRTS